jgi:hypothetical protein
MSSEEKESNIEFNPGSNKIQFQNTALESKQEETIENIRLNDRENEKVIIEEFIQNLKEKQK